MADPRPIAIEVALLESGGRFGTVGKPRMFCRFSAIHVGTHINDGRISVTVRDDVTQTWKEYARKTTVDQACGIVAQLAALGIPGRTPAAEGVDDTSDYWVNLFFRARMEQQATALEIGMHSSGFDGPDAERLRQLFRDLFALAGFEGYCPTVYR